MIDYKKYLAQILNGYRSSYDIETYDEVEEGLVATMVLHMNQTQQFLFKEFQMSSASDDEYVSVFRVSNLTEEYVQTNVQNIFEDGLTKIDIDKITFNKQHMCTRVVALFLCDYADEAALKAVAKCKLRKSFQFSLKGWIEAHTAVVVMSDGSVKTNSIARDTAKFLKKHVKHYMNNV